MPSKIDDHRRKFNKEVKSGLLSMLVLLAIDKDPKPSYGYRIIKTLERTSKGKFKFQEGTIYPILSSLSSKGLLSSYWGDAPEGPRRKYYKLTPNGKKALKVFLEDWSTISHTVSDIVQTLEVRR